MALFDMDTAVLEAQRCYRVLLDAMARPGTLGRLGDRPGAVAVDSPLPPPLGMVLRTLLDEQVSLAVCGSEARDWVREISEITGARLTSMAEADYWVCAGVPSVDMLARLKQGTLLAPEDGATAIVWLNSPMQGKAGQVRISGPGGPSTTAVAASLPLLQTIEHRMAVPCEYPMGIDLFIMDCESRVLGLPRTSQTSILMDGEG
ncbi:MAG: phosphonate C-P lyase system protein PhnH [Rubrivivax sp.]|nr:phosphonate C-P lyase system protein PhnH [Rubrivivax sp.]